MKNFLKEYGSTIVICTIASVACNLLVKWLQTLQ